MCIYNVYIYIYRERERDKQTHMCIYIYIYIERERDHTIYYLMNYYSMSKTNIAAGQAAARAW